MYNSKGPTSKTNFKPTKVSKGFQKKTAPYVKNDKKDKLKPTKAK